MRRIEIRAGNVRVMSKLNDTHTADAIWPKVPAPHGEALPFSAEGNTQGDEIYFSIPVQLQAAEGPCEARSTGGLRPAPHGKMRVQW